MSPQVGHALRQAAIAIALAVLGVVGLEYTNVLDAAGFDANWYPAIAAIIAGAVRTVEGWRDSSRASEGKIIPSDVGYGLAVAAAETPVFPNVHAVGQDVYALKEGEELPDPWSDYIDDEWNQGRY